MKKTKIVICGANGRMGRLLAACAKKDRALEIVGTVGSTDDLRTIISRADTVIDFTKASASRSIAKIVAKGGKALVLGTTGHSKTERASVLRVVHGIPVVWSSNFSTGVNALFYATRLVAELLKDFDVEISETHHTQKKDAPSGTAKHLQHILELAGKRPVPVHSHRIGEVIGDHTVTFAGHGELFELTHRATERATFALGALHAAKWAAKQKPGLYDMSDVLGLRR